MSAAQIPPEILWRRIQSICLSRGMSVSDLAEAAGVGRTTLHNLAKGNTSTPRMQTLKQIADVLQVGLRELCGDSAMIETSKRDGDEGAAESRQFDKRTNTEIKAVFRDCPELFTDWSVREWDELYSCFGVGGELTEAGVIAFARQINSKRETLRKLEIVLDTHAGGLASEIVDSLYRSVTNPPDNLEDGVDLQRLMASSSRRQREGQR